MKAPIMALDLASTSGWAVGEPGGTPAHGSHRFASAGASHEAIFAGAAKWIGDKITFYAPGLVVWEAPLATSFSRGTTTSNTTTLLYGLPAIIGAVAYLRGIYDIRKAETRDVRNHFIGSNPKRAMAKPLVMRQCRAICHAVSVAARRPRAKAALAGAGALVSDTGPSCARYARHLWPFGACPYLRRPSNACSCKVEGSSGHSFAVTGKTMLCKAVRPSPT
jgi:hypothetical protein